VDESDFITSLGRPFLAHRLRRLSEVFVGGYSDWLPQVGVTAPARSLSTILLLEAGPLGVTELAARLRLSHVLMIGLVKRLEELGFVTLERDPADARRRPAQLTRLGEAEAQRARRAVTFLDRAFAQLFDEIGLDLLLATERSEKACRRKSFGRRLSELSKADDQER